MVYDPGQESVGEETFDPRNLSRTVVSHQHICISGFRSRRTIGGCVDTTGGEGAVTDETVEHPVYDSAESSAFDR